MTISLLKPSTGLTRTSVAPRGNVIDAGIPVATRPGSDLFRPADLRTNLFNQRFGTPFSIFNTQRPGNLFGSMRMNGSVVPALPAQTNTLTIAEKITLNEFKNGKQGTILKAEYEKVKSSPDFKAMTAGLQTKTLKSLATCAKDPDSATQLRTMLSSASFKNLEPKQKAYALDVFDNSDRAGRKNLSALLDRQVNGKSAALDTDSKGVTLIERLSYLSRGALDLRFEGSSVSRKTIVSSILQETATPGQVNQDARGTCTVTSMQYMLCQSNPAEYVRVMQGLMNPAGSVKLASGSTLTRVADSIANDNATGRSPTERVFQSAMMELSNGTDLTYSNALDVNRRNADDQGGSGLNDVQEERGLEALFGKSFTIHAKSDLGVDQVMDTLSKRNPGMTFTALDWGVDAAGGHVVVVTKIEDGRVFFRNPWGATTSSKGTTYSNPTRRLEDGDNRIESMTEADFRTALRSVIVD